MYQMSFHTEFQLTVFRIPELDTPPLNIMTCSTCHKTIQDNILKFYLLVSGEA